MTKSNMPNDAEAERTGTSHSARLSHRAPLFIGISVLLLLMAIGPASASATPPIYEGDMSFPAIHGPSDTEEFSWEVSLDIGQELELVDDRHAEVYYAEGHHPAFGITAEPAHDADGTTVPTNLSVSAGDVITLTVHHRAGNPAAGGVPFEYPIVAGEGWEGGFQTEIVTGPKDEQELREEREKVARESAKGPPVSGAAPASEGCVVPRLKGRSLKAAKKRLRKVGCGIGRVRKGKGTTAGTGRVVKQSPRPGRVLVPGATVTVTLGR